MTRPRSYYPQSEHTADSGCGFGVRAYALLIAVLALAMVLDSWLVANLVLLAPLLYVRATGRGMWRAGVSIDEQGLTEWYPLGVRRRTAWGEVTHIDTDAAGASLHTARRVVRLDRTLCDWRRAVAESQRACGWVQDHASEAEAEPVPADRVARWLGMAAGETLVLRASRRPSLTVLAPVLVWGLMAVRTWRLGTGVSVPAFLIVLGLARLAWPGRLAREVRQVRASAEQLSFQTRAGWHEVPWHGVLSVGDGQDGVVVVETAAGEFWLTDGLPDRERLAKALRLAVAARAPGQALPRLTEPVPDTALSLTGAGEAEVERGLSVAEDRP